VLSPDPASQQMTRGGGIHLQHCSLSAANVTLSFNLAGKGGGLYLGNSTSVMATASIVANTAGM
jgi:hypothetical protein